MGWFVRDAADADVFLPLECPDYTNATDSFTIKLFHGGDLTEDCTGYLGGEMSYIDWCDVDQIGIIEVNAMFAEVGEIGNVSIYFKTHEGIWPLETDQDVLEMCALIPPSSIVQVYGITKATAVMVMADIPSDAPQTQTQLEVEDELTRTRREKAIIESFYELDGFGNDFYGYEAFENEAEVDIGGQQILAVDDRSEGSDRTFHGDSSNIDSTDDEVCNNSKKRCRGKEAESSSYMALEAVMDKDEKLAEVLSSSESSKWFDSDDERMVANSTDDDDVSFPVFNEKTEMAAPKFALSMLFSSVKIFREAVKKQAIIERRPIWQKRNYGSRAKFVCEKGCDWKIYAGKMQNSETYQVTLYNGKHTCMQTFHQKQINSGWVAKYYEDDIRMNPTWPLAAFQKKVVNDWNCDISIHAIGKAKKKALESINGKYGEQFALVNDYRHEVMKVMPDSTILVVTERVDASDERRFQRMYICLGPIKRGFRNGCRPLLGLDGCHLKGPFGGQLLAAVGVDANDGMYPVAWAVVEAENADSWNWFLETIKSDLDISNDGGWKNYVLFW